MGKQDDGHMRHLPGIAEDDINHLIRKEKKYKGSWKKRGGPGAFHMLARKIDRIENEVAEKGDDIFELCKDPDFRKNEVGDLRRYLMLVEAEMRNFESVQEMPAEFQIGEKEGDPRV